VATVKGIAMATGAAIVGVTSLEALAFGLEGDDLVVSVVPGGKGELYVQASRGGRSVLAATHVRIGDLPSRIAALEPGGRVVVAGEAAATVDWSALGDRVSLRVDVPHDAPRATVVGRIALSRTPEDADALEPLYVRPPEITVSKGPKPMLSAPRPKRDP
jgi:tRNA threonylcarbamoyladenosine biosynthesis protein TsaB